MATLHWQGAASGTGHTSVAAYDFNVPSNWKVGSYGTYPGYWPTSLTGPRPQDVIVVGTYITARTPLLFGGYTGTMAAGGYGQNGIGGTGTTFNSSLLNAIIVLSPEKYPFPYFGGGVTGDIYNYLFSENVKNGAGLTNESTLGSALDIARSQLGLKLKVTSTIFLNTTGTINSSYASGLTTTDGYPNYSVVDIDFVQSRSAQTGVTAGVCYTELNLSQAGETAGQQNAGLGNVTITDGRFNVIKHDRKIANTQFYTENIPATSTGKPLSITLNNTMVRSIVTPNCDFNVAADSTVGTLTVAEGYLPYYAKSKKDLAVDNREITFLGKANTNLANSTLGYLNTASTSATGAYVSGIYVNKQYAALNDGHYDYIPTVVIGSPEGLTSAPVTIENIQIVAAGASGAPSNIDTLRRWNILFNGNATVTTIANDGGLVSAYSDIKSDSTVTIGELQMRNNAVLDLTQAPNFNGWYFGTTTTGNSVSVLGGINFLDDSSIVLGSAGVRLYNTKVIAGYDVRAATDVPTTSKFSVFVQDVKGKG
jgi:hypothetical protein